MRQGQTDIDAERWEQTDNISYAKALGQDWPGVSTGGTMDNVVMGEGVC